MKQFNLYIQSQGTTCQFRLTWGQGQSIAVSVAYPTEVFRLYEIWQTAYLNYYRSFRARVGVSGIAKLPQVDWRSKLNQSDAELLTAFQLWLAQAALLPMRLELTKALRDETTDLFITCESPEFDRLPWEAWRDSPEFLGELRIARTPSTIRSQVGERIVRSRLRILVILGDETGLDFQKERDALKSVQRYADVEFVGWQGRSDETLRSRIRSAISDSQGWDLLFFAGHSNETSLTGGELGIAPGESLLLMEILNDLRVAIDRGLQFAIFNSCKGLSIAQTLIDAGLSQVIIMREPVHNDAAQQFLMHFLQQFILGTDVDRAMRSACNTLAHNPNFDYPASQWVPSLFRHPASQLLQCPPIDRLRWFKQWKPDRWEAFLLIILSFLSLFNPFQDVLMDTRQGIQTLYRLVTEQIPQEAPPIRLVVIDQSSIKQAGLVNPQPMNWKYLGSVLDRVADYQPKIIGLDFILDQPKLHKPDEISSIRTSLQKFQTIPFVFASYLDQESEFKFDPIVLAQPLPLATSGHTNTADWYLPSLYDWDTCVIRCHFSMRLANQGNSIVRSVHPVTRVSRIFRQLEFSRNFRQFWLRPIQDFSIPPDRIYQSISATELGKIDRSVLANQVVMIVANYKEAGLNDETIDYTTDIPLAIRWGTPLDKPSSERFTGGERLAYATHHFMTRHFVIPIPDLWGVLIAGAIAKLWRIRSNQRSRRRLVLEFLDMVL